MEISGTHTKPYPVILRAGYITFMSFWVVTVPEYRTWPRHISDSKLYPDQYQLAVFPRCVKVNSVIKAVVGNN